MNPAPLIARALREVYNGKNWTWVDLRTALQDVDWKAATARVGELNPIALLVYHMDYYVRIQLKVLQGGSLEGSDKDSFNMPPVQSQGAWEALVKQAFDNAEALAQRIEKLPEERLGETFSEEKYGDLYRNLQGNVEHLHYHLGQILVLKKLVKAT
jgi:uncharacterized damage-inducible protein DinB